MPICNHRTRALVRGAALGMCVVVFVSGCRRNRWYETAGPESNAAPAIAAHVDGSIYIAATNVSNGHVEYASTAAPGSFTPWQSIGTPPPGEFMPDMSPFLLQARSALNAYARGTDHNLYRAAKLGVSPWTQWTAIISDGSVRGRFDAAYTFLGTSGGGAIQEEEHLVYVSSNGCRYVRSTIAGLSQAHEWSGCLLEAAIATDGTNEVGIVLRFAGRLEFAVTTRATGWTVSPFQPLSRNALTISNLVRFGASYHVLFADSKITDDVTYDAAFALLHAWFDASTGHVELREVDEYKPQGGEHARPGLTSYRNKLLASWTLPNRAIESARWDNADPELPWILYGVAAQGAGDTGRPSFRSIVAHSCRRSCKALPTMATMPMPPSLAIAGTAHPSSSCLAGH